mgnify:CR=1 FL=1
MKKIKVYIERSQFGYSAYMDDTPLDYSCIGEGKTVEETISDFNNAYNEMRSYYEQEGKPFEEITYEFYYDVASFLQEYAPSFSLAGLERITGVTQTMLGHYLHGRRKPSKKTIEKIEKGVNDFARKLSSLHFA